MTRLVPQSCSPTQVPMLHTQTPISFPEVKTELARALLGLWGKRCPKEEWAAPPLSLIELLDQERNRGLWRRCLGVLDSYTWCMLGRCLGLWGIPAQNGPPECPVPVGKSDTVALRAQGPRGVYPYIFIISNFIIK